MSAVQCTCSPTSDRGHGLPTAAQWGAHGGRQMSWQKLNNRSLQVMAELHNLLANLPWDTRHGAYVGGKTVAILLNPQPAEVADRRDVMMTVLPLGDATSTLEGTPILQHSQRSGVTHYG